ncbi:MAG TPA: PQQ-dependent sugar dehydrogenase [Gaiella sp.]
MTRIALLLAVACGAIAVGATSAAPSASPRLVTVARGFASPVLATQAPGEPQRLYVVEQPGRIRVVERGKVKPGAFLDVRSLVLYGGEQGLLGLAFSPSYVRDHTFYVDYTARPDGATKIVRYRSRNGRAVPGSAQQILRIAQPYANHNGGNIVFGPDGRLWVGMGDGGSAGDPENRAQNPDSLLGKMLRLDVRRARPTPEIFALGLRNPWRFSFDRKTKDLWIGDVGQGSIEEIDHVPRGTPGQINFGWDVFEGHSSFEDKALGPGRLVQPVAEYTHDAGCSVTGGYVYRGNVVPALNGRYVFGDYCSGTIWSMPATGGEPRVEAVKVPQLTSFGESLDGAELYAVSQTGTVSRFAR